MTSLAIFKCFPSALTMVTICPSNGVPSALPMVPHHSFQWSPFGPSRMSLWLFQWCSFGLSNGAPGLSKGVLSALSIVNLCPSGGAHFPLPVVTLLMKALRQFQRCPFGYPKGAPPPPSFALPMVSLPTSQMCPSALPMASFRLFHWLLIGPSKLSLWSFQWCLFGLSNGAIRILNL